MRFSVSVAVALLVATFPMTAHAALLAFYPFDADATDASGNGNHGVLSANAPTLATGFEGNGYSFDGATGKFIELPVNIGPTALPQITFGGWFNAGAADVLRGIFSHDTGLFDRTIDIDNRDGGTFSWSALAGNTNVASGSPVVLNTWTFVAVRHNQTTGDFTLDVDGNQFTRTGVVYQTGAAEGLATAFLGKNPNFDLPFIGSIDNAFIFDEFLSNARIGEIRTGGAAAILPAVVPEAGSLALVLPALGLLSTALVRRSTARGRD